MIPGLGVTKYVDTLESYATLNWLAEENVMKEHIKWRTIGRLSYKTLLLPTGRLVLLSRGFASGELRRS